MSHLLGKELNRKELFESHQLRRNTENALPEPVGLEEIEEEEEEEEEEEDLGENNLPDVKGVKSKSFDSRTKAPQTPPEKRGIKLRVGSRDSTGEPNKQNSVRDRSRTLSSQTNIDFSFKGLKKKLFGKKHSDSENSQPKTKSSSPSTTKSVKRSNEALLPTYITNVEDFPKDVKSLIKQLGLNNEEIQEHLRIFVSILEFDKKRGLIYSKPKKEPPTTTTSPLHDDLVKSAPTHSDIQPVQIPTKTLSTGNANAPEIKITLNDVEPDNTENQPETPKAEVSRENQQSSEGGNEIRISREKYQYPNYVNNYANFRSLAESDLVEENPRQVYRFIQQVGKGGFGRVYDVRTKDHTRLAIKRIPHKDKKEQERNLDELGAMIFCNKHQNVVRIFSPTYICDGDMWIKMEFLQGGTLCEAIKRHSWSEDQLAYVAFELVNALKFLHDNFLIYRDLKPENVMLSTDGDVKLIDLGLLCDVKEGNAGRLAGSAFWLTPEMIRREPYSFSVDIWALACVLIEMACPKSAPKIHHVKLMWQTGMTGECVWKLNKSSLTKSSVDFQKFISICTSPNPADRPTTSQLLSNQFIEKRSEKQIMQKLFSLIFLQNSLDIRL